MTLRRIGIHACMVLAFAVGAVTVANAQQRTFVASFGNDANSCITQTAPCRTFQGAHDKVASGGEVVALDSAGYGVIVISKSVTLIGTGVSATLTAAAGDAISITTGGLTVALRDLRIQGRGTADDGIVVTATGNVHIQGCTIERFTGNGIDYTTNGVLVIKDTVVREVGVDGIGISAVGGTANVTIADCIVERSGADGVDFVSGPIEASVTRTISSNNGDEGFCASAAGSESRISITFSTAANNDEDGFLLGAGQMNLEWCTSHRNGEDGMQVDGSGTMRVSNSVSTNNLGCGFFNSGTGTFESRENNTVRGNATVGMSCGIITAIIGT